MKGLNRRGTEEVFSVPLCLGGEHGFMNQVLTAKLHSSGYPHYLKSPCEIRIGLHQPEVLARDATRSRFGWCVNGTEKSKNPLGNAASFFALVHDRGGQPNDRGHQCGAAKHAFANSPDEEVPPP